MAQDPIQSVQVNLLLGFLGVGKTSAIRHLIGHRPQDERWAVLVNEFGEIGVDAALIGDTGIAVKQIPGGCMCCAAGPVTRVALNALLRQERPDRLLIEPSGLGHPADIIRLLQAPEYRTVLELGAVITLLDPRHVIQKRYQDHPLFNDQIRVADHWLFNKTDLCSPEILDQAEAWVRDHPGARAALADSAPLPRITQGQMPVQLLYSPRTHESDAPGSASTRPAVVALPTLDWRSTPQAPEPGYWAAASHSADGFHSLGWRISAQEHWQSERLLEVLYGLDCLRIKGVVKTESGWLWFNLAEGELSAGNCGEQTESIIELIHDEPLNPDRIRAQLEECRQSMAL